MAIDALVLRHKAIIIHNADKVYCIGPVWCHDITFVVEKHQKLYLYFDKSAPVWIGALISPELYTQRVKSPMSQTQAIK